MEARVVDVVESTIAIHRQDVMGCDGEHRYNPTPQLDTAETHGATEFVHAWGPGGRHIPHHASMERPTSGSRWHLGPAAVTGRVQRRRSGDGTTRSGEGSSIAFVRHVVAALELGRTPRNH